METIQPTKKAFAEKAEELLKAEQEKFEPKISLQFLRGVDSEFKEMVANILVKKLKKLGYRARKRIENYKCTNHGFGSDAGQFGCSCAKYWVVDVKQKKK